MKIRAPGLAILLAENALPEVGHTTWNQVARFGEWRGHQAGPFAFTAETFAEIITNFEATENRRIPVDYEHLSEVLPKNAAQEGVPAVAWIVALEARGDELWAAFEWVDAQAVEYVRAKKYLYLSPSAIFDAVDRVTGQRCGARLTSAALTNHPFLDGMAPLVASDPSITTRLGLAPGDVHIPVGVGTTPRKEPPMTPEEKAAADAAAKKMADDAMCAGRYNAIAPKLKALASSLDMDPEATEDALLERLQQIVAEMVASQKAEAETMADAVVASWRVSKDGRADLVALCLSDRKRFDRMFPAKAGAPVLPDANTHALLTGRVAPAGAHPTPPPAIDDTDPMAEAREADTLAAKIMAEKKVGYAEAVQLASREIRERAVSVALSQLPARAAR
jgi:hypothetical protein